MRLIDTENFSKVMKDYFTDMITHHKYNVDCVDCNADLQHLLDEQPTAYDIGKVVEDIDEYITKIVGRKSALYQTIMQIVKGGGKDEIS